MTTFVFAESTKTNSLGRAISLAISAETLGPVRLYAFHDGPVWQPSKQFGVEVLPFRRRDISKIVNTIAEAAHNGQTAVWASKCIDPLPRLLAQIARKTSAVVVADFDDHDIALMQAYRRPIAHRLRMPATRRKHPWRIRRAQTRAARTAHALTFSSSALAQIYAGELGATDKPWTVVPHTRRVPAAQPRVSRLIQRIGFLGTIRPHKGADELLAALRSDETVTLVTFDQDWRPPADLAERVVMVSPTEPLRETYERVDAVLLPTDASTIEGRYQLPAKLIDAAAWGKVILATPTAPVEEHLSAGYIAVTDWSTLDLRRIAQNVDLAAVGQRAALIHVSKLAPAPTGERFRALMARSRGHRS